MSNAMGLVIVISLLGQGVIGLPKHLWGEGNLLRKLRFYEFQAKQLSDKIEDTHSHMIKQLAVCIIYYVNHTRTESKIYKFPY